MSLIIIIHMSNRQPDQSKITFKKPRQALLMTSVPKFEAQQPASEVNISSKSNIASSKLIQLPPQPISYQPPTVTIPSYLLKPQVAYLPTNTNNSINAPQQQNTQNPNPCQKCSPQIALLEKSIENLLRQLQQHSLRQIQNLRSMLDDSQKFHERFIKLADDVRHSFRQLR